MKFYNGYISELKNNQIFVFGSNPEGRHGAGTAKIAKNKFGAIYGQGRGLQGNSYALPTKNLKANFEEKSTGIVYERYGNKSISPEQIIINIKELYALATERPELEFFIAYQNTNNNLNGYSSEDILGFFLEAGKPEIPENILLSDTFKELYTLKTSGKTTEDLNDFTIKVVNIKKTPEVKTAKNYVYCGRGSALGNPYNMENYSQEERDRVCKEYAEYLPNKLKENDIGIREQLNLIWKTGRENGEVQLGCYCAPQACHCDTIKETLLTKQKELKNKKPEKKKTRTTHP